MNIPKMSTVKPPKFKHKNTKNLTLENKLAQNFNISAQNQVWSYNFIVILKLVNVFIIFMLFLIYIPEKLLLIMFLIILTQIWLLKLYHLLLNIEKFLMVFCFILTGVLSSLLMILQNYLILLIWFNLFLLKLTLMIMLLCNIS